MTSLLTTTHFTEKYKPTHHCSVYYPPPLVDPHVFLPAAVCLLPQNLLLFTVFSGFLGRPSALFEMCTPNGEFSLNRLHSGLDLELHKSLQMGHPCFLALSHRPKCTVRNQKPLESFFHSYFWVIKGKAPVLCCCGSTSPIWWHLWLARLVLTVLTSSYTCSSAISSENILYDKHES